VSTFASVQGLRLAVAAWKSGAPEAGTANVSLITTVATNAWSDQNRAELSAGALSGSRVLPLEAPSSANGGASVPQSDTITDARTLSSEGEHSAQARYRSSTQTLDPRLREILIARHVDGESTADIGQRFGRTQQTITAWLRHAARELKTYLDDSFVERHAVARVNRREKPTA
jgi:DNA-directed RNA polymerase specialized sigma24 family protein